AWAGPLRLTNHYADRLAGITAADSVGFSAHKWLYQPKGSALVMFQEAQEAHQALSYGGGYLATPNIGLLGSTPAAAVPLAAMLLSWGRNGLVERIEADMDKADHLAALVRADNRFELWGPNRTGVIVWRPREAQAEEIRSRIKQAWVSLTEINGEMWLRSVAANPSADPDFLFAQVVDAL
ncbi:MAG: pyridoxal-dependent decarboxylase, partial [Pseudomonadota bacterium]|nr:pyridoxal-dependent decarboxylase [Pseudomonadota bacterium]